ncbi:MAG: helix-turn-helix domain-containing protein, partial [bacterium]|nr:helix-turn-helix domain-containing protein [bacterium]
MTTNKIDRQSEILKLFKNVDSSDLSTKKYFTTYETPVSLSQYYRLRKQFEQHGFVGLEDNRTVGNARKLNSQQVELVSTVLTYNRHLTSKSLQCELQDKWGIELDISRIDQLRRDLNLTRIKPK